MTPGFWKNKKVLITGHSGFKGSWLTLWLKHLEAEIIGYSLEPPTNPSLFEIMKIKKLIPSIIGDIRDLAMLKKTINEYQPEIIIHMAAQSLVGPSYVDPVKTYSTNVMGTVHLLEAARFFDCVKIATIITSDKCYENNEWTWGYRENEPLGGHDPYSNSKSCAELVTDAYRRSFFTKSNNESNAAIASARAGNVIGGGDWAKNRLIPDIISSFLENRPALIRNPESIRPWQHVLEPLNGYLTLVEHLWKDKDKYSGSWNFGPNEDDSMPVSWVADKLSSIWGNGACWELDNFPHPFEANHLKLNCSKAKTLLKWAPKLSLLSSLEWIVEWYQSYKDKEDLYEVTINQINIFQNL